MNCSGGCHCGCGGVCPLVAMMGAGSMSCSMDLLALALALSIVVAVISRSSCCYICLYHPSRVRTSGHDWKWIHSVAAKLGATNRHIAAVAFVVVTVVEFESCLQSSV